MRLRPATSADLPRMWEIIRQAKAQMYRENKQQWDESYPLPEHLQADIEKGYAHVLEDEGTFIAYGAVAFDGEPAYDHIEGEWLSVQPYVVVHRLAVADEAKRKGVAVRFMQEAENLAVSRGVHSFKVDTNFDNFYMQKVLQKCGFTYCGGIHYQRGERLGYEKLIGEKIRKATLQDAAAIVGIYNEYILHSTVTFETEPLTVEQMCERMSGILSSCPYLVYEEDGKVLGYCYAHEWKERAAYCHTWETSVYVDASAHHKGIGEALMRTLIADCRQREVHALIACLTEPNEPSSSLHRKLGFVKVSHFKEVGNKFGRWLDVGDYELIL